MAPQKIMVPTSEVMSVTHRLSCSKSSGDAAPVILSVRQEAGAFALDGVPMTPVVSVPPAPGVPPFPVSGWPSVECVFPGVPVAPVVLVTVGLATRVGVDGVDVPGVSVGCGAPVVGVGVNWIVIVPVGVTTTVNVMVGMGVTGTLVGVMTVVGVGVSVTCVGTMVGVGFAGCVGRAVGVMTGDGVGWRTGVFVITGVGVCCG
jgi:hypothetical protein